MAPVEDLEARDLGWISDFVMQQVVMMLRPMMEQLQQTDSNVDDVYHTVQRLSMDISEVRSDLERTNKHLSILRQGLGVQNESRCVLQRNVESSTRATKRLDEQMEGLLETMRAVECTIGRLTSDVRSSGAKHDELSRLVAESTCSIEDIQAKVERTASETHVFKDELRSTDAKLEVWQRELRELRRQQLAIIGSKALEDKTGGGCPPPASSQGCRALTAASDPCWPQKKNLTPMDVCGSTKDAAGFAACTVAAGTGSDVRSSVAGQVVPGGSSQSKRMSRLGSGSKGSSLLSQELEFGAVPPRSSSRAGIWVDGSCGGLDGGVPCVDDALLSGGARPYQPEGGTEDIAAPQNQRLPLLAVAAGRPGPGAVGRPPDGGFGEGPRRRFSATMMKPSSRGSPC